MRFTLDRYYPAAPDTACYRSLAWYSPVEGGPCWRASDDGQAMQAFLQAAPETAWEAARRRDRA